MPRLEERIGILGGPEDVWNVLRDFRGVDKWAPYVRDSTLVGEREAGVGSRRMLRHAWGFRLEESVVGWSEGRGYAFEVVRVPYPMRNVREAWAVDASNPHVTVTTSVEYDMHLGPLGRFLDRLLVHHLIRREMRGGLRGLKRYVESRGAMP